MDTRNVSTNSTCNTLPMIASNVAMESLRVELQQTKRRNYSFAEQMGGASSHCPHGNTRRWGNAHGRGRKCVDCGKELEYKRAPDLLLGRYLLGSGLLRCRRRVSLWYHIHYRFVEGKPPVPPLLAELRQLPWKSAFFAWAILVTLAVSALVYPKLREAIGLSVEVQLGLCGFVRPDALSAQGPDFIVVARLAFAPAGRRALRRVNRRSGFCTSLLRAFAFSFFAHFCASLCVALAAHLVIFLVVLFLAWAVVSLARCPGRRKVRPPPDPARPDRREIYMFLAMTPLLGLLKVVLFLAIFLFDCAFLDRFGLGSGGQVGSGPRTAVSDRGLRMRV
ncbi:unnamed protein product [Symbiodinium natans]|uniref:Uncharacterized protein n=1 Tax=Symbiodinium natans TaxID=878477 RepID=A0A812U834_9DINO|nr:unnamed protein product [Symbiodinium natans]